MIHFDDPFFLPQPPAAVTFVPVNFRGTAVYDERLRTLFYPVSHASAILGDEPLHFTDTTSPRDDTRLSQLFLRQWRNRIHRDHPWCAAQLLHEAETIQGLDEVVLILTEGAARV